MARATSSTTSAIILVAFNLIPLVGVLFWSWNVATLLVLYWVENGVIGALNVPKILLAEGAPTTTLAAPKVATAVFFVIHYGLFWFVHGIFVWTLPMFFGGGAPGAIDGLQGLGPTLPPDIPPEILNGDLVAPDAVVRSGPNVSAVLYGGIGLAISHAVSFVVNFLGRQEYRSVTPQQQAMAPYGRLVILHVTIIVGAIVSLTIGSPVGAILVLVLLKTGVDLAFHLREHGDRAAFLG